MNERTELLVSMIAGEEATPEQWDEFHVLAGGEPQLWRELAIAQRDQATLTHAMQAVTAVADRVSLPLEPVSAGVAGTEGGRSPVLARIGFWTGWAAAAILTIVVLVGLPSQTRPRPAGPGHAGEVVASGMPVSASPSSGTGAVEVTDMSELDDSVIDELRQVVGEMPTNVLLDVRPRKSGDGWEVLYLRPVIERRQVPDLYRVNGADEQGQPQLVRYEQPGGPM